MYKLIGHQVTIKLKDGELVDGLIFDSDDESVYLQSDVDLMVVIPRENIKLYMSERSQGAAAQENRSAPNIIKQKQPSNLLNVFVNDELVADIPMPPSMSLASFSDEIMRIMMANEDVQYALSGSSGQEISYEPGNVYISTSTVKTNAGTNNGFSMEGGPALTQMCDPSQMVGRLNNAVKRQREQKQNGKT